MRISDWSSDVCSSDLGSNQAPLLPESAVQSEGGQNYVYIVGKDDKVIRRNVTTGEVSDAGVAIAGGLDGSERVVVSAGAVLNPGDKVKTNLTKRASSGPPPMSLPHLPTWSIRNPVTFIVLFVSRHPSGVLSFLR